MNRIAIGTKFNRLTFAGLAQARTADNHIVGMWDCECGSRTEVAVSRVKNGYTRSCGCFAREQSSENATTHGMRNSREYSSWMSMKGRCLDPNNKDFPRWGGIGVTIAPEWVASFEAFFEHVGTRPANTTLDRIDNTKGYEPGNVRWATASEQQTNRRDSYFAEIAGVAYQSVAEAAKAHNVSEMTIIRWCDGYTDNRRLHQNNHTVLPRPGCRRWRKYAS